MGRTRSGPALAMLGPMRCSLILGTFALLPLLPAQDLAAKVDALAKPLADAGLAASLVVGVLDGDTMLVRSYGKVGENAPDGTTLYEIGSVSKVFTGILLADAVTRGVCKLDDPVQSLLPEGVTMPKWEATPVLLWHLSTHTSGLPRLPNMKGSDPSDPYAHFDEAKLFAEVGKARVRWEPGSKYEYSNFAVGLLGHLLAKKQGFASFEALLKERITTPLGMQDTTVALADAQKARMAPPRNADGDAEHLWDLAALAGAGGIRSSVADMLKFARAQFRPAGPLATLDDVRQPKRSEPSPADALDEPIDLAQQKRHDGANGIAMGLGWHFARDGKTRWHNGGTGGFHSYLAVVPGDRRAVCVLSNTTSGLIDQVGERILQHLYGMAVAPPKVEIPVAVERAQLQRLVGKYRMEQGGAMFTITLDDRGLSAQLTGQQACRVHAKSPTQFVYRVVDASLTFELEGDTAKVLVLHQNGEDMKCTRIEAEPAKKQDAK